MKKQLHNNPLAWLVIAFLVLFAIGITLYPAGVVGDQFMIAGVGLLILGLVILGIVRLVHYMRTGR